VNDAQAKAVIAAAPLQYVGVFRNAPLEEVVARAQALGWPPQLHGDEDQAYIDALRDALADNVRIWKALSVGETFPARTLRHVDKYLLDNGRAAAASALTGACCRARICATSCWRAASAPITVWKGKSGCAGLDFNSGVESQPGIKDASKLASVFQTLRAY
jgi:indole-3-glycerol phosphate synthase/phosphoribosylanthranilate isomerase